MRCDFDTVVDIFSHAQKCYPLRPACSFAGATLSYSELAREVDLAAAHLAGMGVTPGTRVAIALPNSSFHLIAFMAALKLGAVVVEHNPQFTQPELEALFTHHGARCAVAWQGCAIPPGVNTAWVSPAGFDWPQPPARPQFPQLSAQDPALILHTSGTTGAPKGVHLSHGNLAANAQQLSAWVPDLKPGQERFLAALPMFHSYGLTMAVTLGLAVGAQIIFLPRPTAQAVVEAISTFRPTWFPAVPTLYERVIGKAGECGADLRGVSKSISGAATLPAHLIAQWESLTGGVLVEGYGLTEASPVLTCNPLDERRRAGTIGCAVPGTELRVARLDDYSQDCRPGEEGELLARGPQVSEGEKSADGWLHTGDICVKEDGFYRLVGRRKEIIKVGGFSVYPAEVERVLRRHHAVSQAAVVDTGQVTACVVSSQPVSAAELERWCRAHLTGYKVPRHFLFFPALAADALGKLRRTQVQQEALKSQPTCGT